MHIVLSLKAATSGGFPGQIKSSMSEYCGPIVPVPPIINGCRDSFGMVEFGHVLRVSYDYLSIRQVRARGVGLRQSIIRRLNKMTKRQNKKIGNYQSSGQQL
jgi:hypothetical protein